MPFSRIRALPLTACLLLMAGSAHPENPDTVVPAALTVPQIVEGMLRHNRTQAAKLKHYQELRHYQVQYKGFAADLVGKMDVSRHL